MTMFLIQSLLWLLAAFFLGYGLGRWLKGVFCKRQQAEAKTKLEADTSHLRVPVTTAAIATGTAAALATKREPAKPTVTVRPVEPKAPVVTAIPSEPKLEAKLDLDLPQAELAAPKLGLAKVEADLPTVEAKLPEVDIAKIEVKDIATGMVGLGSAALAVAAVKLDAPDGEVNLNVTELVKSPETEVDFKTLQMNLPSSNTDLTAVEWRNNEASADIVTLNLPKVEVKLPDLELPPVDLGLAAANLQTPEGKADLTALRVDLADVPVHLPQAGIDLEHAKVAAGLVELNTPEGLYTVEGAKVEALDRPEGSVAVRLTKPDGDVQLAAFATDPSGQASLAAVDNSASGLELQTFELGSLQSGLVNPEWLASLKAAALAEGNTILAGAADQALANTSTPSLTSIEIGSFGAGLNPDWLVALQKLAIGTGVGAVVAKAGSVLADTPKPVDELQIEAPIPTTVRDVVLATVADTLANQPNPVDESDRIESDKNIAEAVLNPTGLTATEISGLNQGANTDTLITGLTLAAASAGTVAAVQANLESGVQPMIVDESDAIEAIKLAWDGELSPEELAALEHTLILRPGETGRLGLVTCSVPGANCVGLGGLEGDLHQSGTAMRSKLFDMAVTHNDDGSYVFSKLSNWMSGWVKSSDLTGATTEFSAPAEADEPIHLVWDQDSHAVDYAAGYELILREGQYGDLGLVSCAVPATGVVSLGGIEGSVADGQTAVSKLYGILVERAGEVYTFKQFAKPSIDSLGSKLPVTISEPIEMLEPNLAWSDDTVRRGVQHLIAASQDQRGSKLVSQLWDADSGYDCGLIEGEESLVLKPGLYGKLGSVHCGVTKPGRVVVSGDVSALAEGEGVLFHLYSIVVCRDDEDNYCFERLKDLL